MADALDAIAEKKAMRDYYNSVSRRLYSKLRQVGTRQKRVKYEKEIAHNLNLINMYGFDFFPEVYVKPYIDKISEIVSKL